VLAFSQRVAGGVERWRRGLELTAVIEPAPDWELLTRSRKAADVPLRCGTWREPYPVLTTSDLGRVAETGDGTAI